MADPNSMSIEELEAELAGFSAAPIFSSASIEQPSRLSMLGNDLLGGASSVFDTASLGAAKYAFAAPASLGAYLTNKYYGAPTDLGTEYDKALADVIQTQNAYKDAARSSSIPLTSVAGIPLSDIPASFATPLIRALGAVKYIPKIGEAATLGGQSLNLAKNVLKAGAQGALISGVSEGLNTQGDWNEKALAAWDDAKTGALLGGGLSLTGAGLASATSALPIVGDTLRRASLRARAGDYLKTSGKGQMQTSATGEAETLTQQALDSVIKDGTLGKWRNPGRMLQKLEAKSDSLNGTLQGLIDKVELAGVKVKPPNFFATQRMIQRGEVPAVDAQGYVEKIIAIQDAVKTMGKGSLSYLQNQKKAYGALYSSGNSSDDKFVRSIYHELQAEIEKVVPEAKGLNKQIQKLILTRPILARGVTTDAAENPIQGARKFFYTTGGGAITGLSTVLGPALGAVIGGTLAAGNTYIGRDLIGRLLQKTPQVGKGLAPLGLRILAIPSSGATEVRPTTKATAKDPSSMSIEELEKLLTEQPATKKDISLLEDVSIVSKAEAEDKPSSNEMARLEKASEGFNVAKAIAGSSKMVQAVSRVESNLKHASISSRGAIGIMQLMPTTAKELGVDPYDPRQNIKGGEKYLEQLRDRFKNDKLTFAAYNMGPGALGRAIRESGTRDWERMIKKLGVKSESNKKGIPAQTIAYVPKVMKFYRR